MFVKMLLVQPTVLLQKITFMRYTMYMCYITKRV